MWVSEYVGRCNNTNHTQQLPIVVMPTNTETSQLSTTALNATVAVSKCSALQTTSAVVEDWHRGYLHSQAPPPGPSDKQWRGGDKRLLHSVTHLSAVGS